LSESKIKHLVLDVLKPHSPPLPEFATFLTELNGIEKVDITLVEMDEKTESLKVVLSGTAIMWGNREPSYTASTRSSSRSRRVN